MPKKPRVTINQPGIDRLFQDISQKIEKVDADLRRQYFGKPVDEILQHVTHSLLVAGVQTDATRIREYAEAISEGKPFTLNLN